VTEPSSESRHKSTVMLVVVSGMLAAVLGVYWLVSRARALELATAARTDALRLALCVPSGNAAEMRDTLALAYPDDRPLAGCAQTALSLASSAAKLPNAALLRDSVAASELSAVGLRLSKFGWDSPARALHDGSPLAELSADVAAARELACRIASAEAGQPEPGCSAAQLATEPGATRLVLDAELGGARDAVSWTANAAFAPVKEPASKAVEVGVVAIAAQEGARTWIARSLDGGRTWQTSSIEPAAAASAPRPPEVALLAGGSLLVAHFAPRSERAWSARIARWSADQARPEPSRAFELPERWSPIATGSPLLPLADGGDFALALAASDPARATVWYPPSEGDKTPKSTLVDAPAGRVLAATSAPPSRLLLARKSPTGFVELVAQAVPAPKQPWPEPRTALASWVSDLSLPAGPERWCGLPGEQYFTTVGESPEGSVLVAVGPEQIYPFRFTPRTGGSVGVVCGACPPAGIERSPDGVRVLLPVRRQLSPATVATPIAFDQSSALSAAAACTGEQLVVAYLAGDRVLAQSTRSGEWQFERPTVVAVPDAHGKPVDLRVLGFDDRVVVLWRRADARSRRLRIEMAELRSE
jgi:hypothetical protein